MANDSTRAELVAFLHDLQKVLGYAVEAWEQYAPTEDLDDVYGAWVELQPAFDEAHREIDNVEPDGLQSVGLMGAQLRLKLNGFGRRLTRFWNDTGRGALRSVLRWADVPLGSLATAIPGVDPIKEFKEIVERGIEDGPG